MSAIIGSKKINFSEEQGMLLDVAREFVKDKSPGSEVRKFLESEEGFSQPVWQELVELGWTGINLPESVGGSGLGIAALIPVVESMGKGLMGTHRWSLPYWPLSSFDALAVLLRKIFSRISPVAVQQPLPISIRATGVVRTPVSRSMLRACSLVVSSWSLMRPKPLGSRRGIQRGGRGHCGAGCRRRCFRRCARGSYTH